MRRARNLLACLLLGLPLLLAAAERGAMSLRAAAPVLVTICTEGGEGRVALPASGGVAGGDHACRDVCPCCCIPAAGGEPARVAAGARGAAVRIAARPLALLPPLTGPARHAPARAPPLTEPT